MLWLVGCIYIVLTPQSGSWVPLWGSSLGPIPDPFGFHSSIITVQLHKRSSRTDLPKQIFSNLWDETFRLLDELHHTSTPNTSETTSFGTATILKQPGFFKFVRLSTWDTPGAQEDNVRTFHRVENGRGHLIPINYSVIKLVVFEFLDISKRHSLRTWAQGFVRFYICSTALPKRGIGFSYRN